MVIPVLAKTILQLVGGAECRLPVHCATRLRFTATMAKRRVTEFGWRFGCC